MYCVNCGTMLYDSDKFCPGCGLPIDEAIGGARSSSCAKGQFSQDASSGEHIVNAPQENEPYAPGYGGTMGVKRSKSQQQLAALYPNAQSLQPRNVQRRPAPTRSKTKSGRRDTPVTINVVQKNTGGCLGCLTSIVIFVAILIGVLILLPEPKSANDSEVPTTAPAATAAISSTLGQPEIENQVSDAQDFIDKLISFGFTQEEAEANTEILVWCGIPTIDGCEMSGDNPPDGLATFRDETDKDRTVWFVTQDRKIFYVALNGNDLYDADKGGFLKRFDDVYIPESDVDKQTGDKLVELATGRLDMYFNDFRYYDGWRIGRTDDVYVVRCEASDGSLFESYWIPCEVRFKVSEDEVLTVTDVSIGALDFVVSR